VSATPQSETDLVDKAGRSGVATVAAQGTERSSRTGREAKSYVLLHCLRVTGRTTSWINYANEPAKLCLSGPASTFMMS